MHVHLIDAACQRIVVNQIPVGIGKRGNYANGFILFERADDPATGVWLLADDRFTYTNGEFLAGRYWRKRWQWRRRVDRDFLNADRSGCMALDRLLGRFDNGDASRHEVAQTGPEIIETKNDGYAKQNDKP